MTSAIAIAGGAGPLLAGVLHDLYGSYAPLLMAGAVLPVVSGLLLFSLGHYPGWDEHDTGAHPK